MNKGCSSTILSVALSLSVANIVHAREQEYKDPYEAYDKIEHWDLDIDDNIDAPAIPDAEKPAVRKYMKGLYKDLEKRNYDVALERDDEVVVITLPTDELFLPNDTHLWNRANRLLSPLKPLFSDPDNFKIVASVNTDNTGSEAYNLKLSEDREKSLNVWFEQNSDPDLVYIVYGLGDTDPVEDNDSRKGRAANRRVEIYIVPGPKIIDLAHRKKL